MQDYFVHESSYVDDGVTIGAGTKVWHFCHIQKGAVIGRNCSLGQNVNIANNVRIGDGVRIQNNVSIYEGVELEDNVFCGPSCVFTNVSTPRAHFPVHGVYARTRIREGASLGANCTIVCGHSVGRSALVAAGGGWLRFRQADRAIREGRDLPAGTTVHVMALAILVVIVAAGISVVV
jgi:UDP-2-acetamido-3-amino-2,3-dideoxy-glucuronate N-acetyltransferase